MVAMRPLLITILLGVCAVPAAAQDLDRDGLADAFEQALLERFTPSIKLDSRECDVAPASFAAGVRDPFVLARDGTLYGQAFRVGDANGRVQVELHFYHLWQRDCGRPSHDLDAEHVSAIVSATSLSAPASEWKADAWYAAAHEDTVCDASSGASAITLHAEAAGPQVFVSRGKHASYLDRGQCKWGCGSDVCDGGRPLAIAKVVNIGEVDAPLNGADWIHSRRWALADKMRSDFDPSTRASLDGTNHIVSLMLHRRPLQSPILAGDTALDGLSTAARSTGRALDTARRHVSKFLRLKN